MVQKNSNSLMRVFDELKKEIVEILFSMMLGYCTLWVLQAFEANFIVTLSMKNLLLNFAYGVYTGLFMLIVLHWLQFPIQYSMHVFALMPLTLSYSPLNQKFLILVVVMILGYITGYYNKKIFFLFWKKQTKKMS